MLISFCPYEIYPAYQIMFFNNGTNSTEKPNSSKSRAPRLRTCSSCPWKSRVPHGSPLMFILPICRSRPRELSALYVLSLTRENAPGMKRVDGQNKHKTHYRMFPRCSQIIAPCLCRTLDTSASHEGYCFCFSCGFTFVRPGMLHD